MNNTPYGPPTNTVAVIRKWREHSMPEQVTDEWLRKIGIKESLFVANRRALGFLGLADEAGNTTDAARRLAVTPSDQYPAVLEELVRAAFAPIFKLVDPRTATRTQVDDAFRGEKPESQRSRMVAFFLGLCSEAGITLHEPPQGGRTSGAMPTRNEGPKRRASLAPPVTAPPPRARNNLLPDGTLFHPAIDAFFREARKLTEGDSWTKEARDFVIQGFTTQLDLFLPVKAKGRSPRKESAPEDGAAES
ncbi:MAG: DUF5343 domain-containing protein [Vulcanimicrobiaceae bacterium]